MRRVGLVTSRLSLLSRTRRITPSTSFTHKRTLSSFPTSPTLSWRPLLDEDEELVNDEQVAAARIRQSFSSETATPTHDVMSTLGTHGGHQIPLVEFEDQLDPTVYELLLDAFSPSTDVDALSSTNVELGDDEVTVDRELVDQIEESADTDSTSSPFAVVCQVLQARGERAAVARLLLARLNNGVDVVAEAWLDLLFLCLAENDGRLATVVLRRAVGPDFLPSAGTLEAVARACVTSRDVDSLASLVKRIYGPPLSNVPETVVHMIADNGSWSVSELRLLEKLFLRHPLRAHISSALGNRLCYFDEFDEAVALLGRLCHDTSVLASLSSDDRLAQRLAHFGNSLLSLLCQVVEPDMETSWRLLALMHSSNISIYPRTYGKLLILSDTSSTQAAVRMMRHVNTIIRDFHDPMARGEVLRGVMQSVLSSIDAKSVRSTIVRRSIALAEQFSTVEVDSAAVSELIIQCAAWGYTIEVQRLIDHFEDVDLSDEALRAALRSCASERSRNPQLAELVADCLQPKRSEDVLSLVRANVDPWEQVERLSARNELRRVGPVTTVTANRAFEACLSQVYNETPRTSKKRKEVVRSRCERLVRYVEWMSVHVSIISPHLLTSFIDILCDATVDLTTDRSRVSARTAITEWVAPLVERLLLAALNGEGVLIAPRALRRIDLFDDFETVVAAREHYVQSLVITPDSGTVSEADFSQSANVTLSTPILRFWRDDPHGELALETLLAPVSRFSYKGYVAASTKNREMIQADSPIVSDVESLSVRSYYTVARVIRASLVSGKAHPSLSWLAVRRVVELFLLNPVVENRDLFFAEFGPLLDPAPPEIIGWVLDQSRTTPPSVGFAQLTSHGTSHRYVPYIWDALNVIGEREDGVWPSGTSAAPLANFIEANGQRPLTYAEWHGVLRSTKGTRTIVIATAMRQANVPLYYDDILHLGVTTLESGRVLTLAQSLGYQPTIRLYASMLVAQARVGERRDAELLVQMIENRFCQKTRSRSEELRVAMILFYSRDASTVDQALDALVRLTADTPRDGRYRESLAEARLETACGLINAGRYEDALAVWTADWLEPQSDLHVLESLANLSARLLEALVDDGSSDACELARLLVDNMALRHTSRLLVASLSVRARLVSNNLRARRIEDAFAQCELAGRLYETISDTSPESVTNDARLSLLQVFYELAVPQSSIKVLDDMVSDRWSVRHLPSDAIRLVAKTCARAAMFETTRDEGRQGARLLFDRLANAPLPWFGFGSLNSSGKMRSEVLVAFAKCGEIDAIRELLANRRYDCQQNEIFTPLLQHLAFSPRSVGEMTYFRLAHIVLDIVEGPLRHLLDNASYVTLVLIHARLNDLEGAYKQFVHMRSFDVGITTHLFQLCLDEFASHGTTAAAERLGEFSPTPSGNSCLVQIEQFARTGHVDELRRSYKSMLALARIPDSRVIHSIVQVCVHAELQSRCEWLVYDIEQWLPRMIGRKDESFYASLVALCHSLERAVLLVARSVPESMRTSAEVVEALEVQRRRSTDI